MRFFRHSRDLTHSGSKINVDEGPENLFRKLESKKWTLTLIILDKKLHNTLIHVIKHNP